MKDEIKEILEDVKRHLDYVEATKQASIRDKEMKVMYDYITNLQEEKMELKSGINKLLEWLYNYKKQIGTKESIILSDEKVLDSLIEIIEGVNNGFNK